jgi:signal transduction histidine kinase
MSNRIEEIIITISTTIIIAILLSFYYYVLRAFKQKQQVYFNELEIIQIEHEKSILKAQIEVQESVFKQISQDIHDNISLTLTLAKLNVNTFLMSQTHLRFEQLHSAADLIGRSLLDLNSISRSLNSDIVEHYGLVRAIEMELDKLNQVGQCVFTVSFDINTERFDKMIELELFRILQESCSNILKHSEASSAILALAEKGDAITLSVQDNGKGFSDSTLEERRSIAPRSGLRNIQNRARMLNGEAYIDSIPGKGTSIIITIPKTHDTTAH